MTFKVKVIKIICNEQRWQTDHIIIISYNSNSVLAYGASIFKLSQAIGGSVAGVVVETLDSW